MLTRSTSSGDRQTGTARSSLFVFPSDLVVEGVREVLARVRERGVEAVTVAVAYHQARDVMPHASVRRVVHRHDGVFLPLPPEVWEGVRLRPAAQPAEEVVAVARLLEDTAPGEVLAWTVFLHNTTLGTAHPDVCAENCFGDRLLADLCPANPDVADYAVALARTAAAAGPVVAEALAYGTFDHGHHHERSFVPLGPGERLLLGLCFCAHCRRAAGAAGVDADRLRAAVAGHLDRVLGGEEVTTSDDPASLSAAVGEDLAGFLAVRQDVVTALTRRVADAVHADGGRLVYLDLTGALLGYGSGTPEGPSAAEQGWRTGVDASALAPLVDGYAYLGYARDVERLRVDVASVVDAVGGRCPVRVVLRPGHPDTGDAANLAEKTAACASLGVAAVDFYNYGMYPWPVLDRIPAALTAAGDPDQSPV
ncbi:hypothetical protein [Streptosporangium carneum]|uniref:hypothetical protein n=1 Tax=Streptosporangium carneum TaxID=47481 RepID=UPI0022F2D70A|nr:hypothetical protein [Streptosporangium carneum]